METILSYLDNMFLNLPKTEKVSKMKEELALMMEDKYNELLAEGKKENEAIGIVISEFGDLKELQEELGLEENNNPVHTSHVENDSSKKRDEEFQKKHIRKLTRKNVEDYRELTYKAAKGISLGVMLCICSPIFLLLVNILEEIRETAFSDTMYVVGGVVPLLLMVGIAVAIFISYGSKLEKYEFLKKEPFMIDQTYLMELEKIKESEKKSGIIKITVGVVLCIFSVIPLLVMCCIKESLVVGGVIVLLLLITIAVTLFILGGMQIDCMKILFQEEEFSVSAKKHNKLIDAIAGIYWPVMAAVYLIWSFATNGWGRTWLIWPIAGIAFGVLAVIISVVEQYRGAR